MEEESALASAPGEPTPPARKMVDGLQPGRPARSILEGDAEKVTLTPDKLAHANRPKIVEG
jgi:hypothetical protein